MKAKMISIKDWIVIIGQAMIFTFLLMYCIDYGYTIMQAVGFSWMITKIWMVITKYVIFPTLKERKSL